MIYQIFDFLKLSCKQLNLKIEITQNTQVDPQTWRLNFIIPTGINDGTITVVHNSILCKVTTFRHFLCELVVNGTDLLHYGKGPKIREILDKLLRQVWETSQLNTKEGLLEYVKTVLY